MAFNLTNVKTQAPKTETTEKAPLPEKLISFIEALHGSGVRINYSTWHALCLQEGVVPATAKVNFSSREVSRLPQGLQYVVTRASGKYHEKALRKWGAEAPMGFEDLPIANADDALSAYNEG